MKPKRAKEKWLIDITDKTLDKYPKFLSIITSSKKLIALLPFATSKNANNVKLIVAAPELLEACKYAFDELNKPDVGAGLDDIASKLKQAIKATE